MNPLSIHRALETYRRDSDHRVREAALIIQRAIEKHASQKPGRGFYRG